MKNITFVTEIRNSPMGECKKCGKAGLAGVYLLSLLAIILWGMSYLWSDSLLSQGIPVEFIVFTRIIIAGFVLLIANKCLGKSLAIKRKDIPKFLLLALFEPFIYFVAETYGIRLTESPTISSLFIATSPIFSVIVGIFVFKEHFSLFNMAGILVCLGGIVMVTLCHGTIGSTFLLGLGLLLVAVLAEVGHASFTKYLADSYEPLVIVMYQFLIGSVYLLPLFLGPGLRNFDASVYLSWSVIRPILSLAVFCSSIAFGLWAYTIKYLGVAKSSIFMSTIPVCTALAGWILGQEILSSLQWAGIVVACIGVVMSQKSKRCRSGK